MLKMEGSLCEKKQSKIPLVDCEQEERKRTDKKES